MTIPAPVCANCGEPLLVILEDWQEQVEWEWNAEDGVYDRMDEEHGQEVSTLAYHDACSAGVPDDIAKALPYSPM